VTDPQPEHRDDGPDPTSPKPLATPPNARRELALATALCLVGAGTVLLSIGQPWATATQPAGPALPAVTANLVGRDLAPLTAGLALLGLASAAALLALGRRLRPVLGVIMTASGTLIMIDTLLARGRVTAEIQSRFADPTVTGHATAWPWLAVLGGLVLACAGVLTVARGTKWPTMSRRYEQRSVPRAEPSMSRGPISDPDDAWRALDRGEDPTL
jgi:uncharacterized membrane protein (TIGR02234 family)